jgi:tetratricopeptide (TPR) repeat protein
MTTTIQSFAIVGWRLRGLLRVRAVVIALACGVSLASGTQAADTTSARPEAADVQKLFESGNDMFRAATEIMKSDRPAAEAKFREAAGAWREVARIGDIHNVKLETNIANASLFAGDVPGAILAYRRALAIDPTDPNVLAGLAAARRSAGTEALALGQTLGKKDEKAKAGGLRGTLASMGELLRIVSVRATTTVSPRTLLFLGALFYCGFFALAALRVLGKMRVPALALAGLLIGTVVTSVPLIAREIRAARHSDAVVLAPNVLARNGPADMYDPAFQEPLRAGLEVAIVESRGVWTKIRLRDGREAWVRSDALAAV